MKNILGIACCLLFSASVFASGSLDIDGSPLVLILKDNSKVKVSTCEDFIKIRKSGGIVKSFAEISDPDFDSAKADLTDCYINALVLQNGFIKNGDKRPSLDEILHHLPATEKLISGDEEKEKIDKDFKGKSVWDTSPDLTKNDDIFMSKSDDTAYRLIDYRTYTTRSGDEVDIMTLTAFTLHGTFGSRKSYIIKSKKDKIWNIEEINQNSPL